MPLKETVRMGGHHAFRSSPKGDPCCTSVLLPKNRKGCFWRSDHLGSVDARPTPGYNALQAKRVELSLVKRELHHEAGKEKRRGIFSTFPSRFLYAAPSLGRQIRSAVLSAEAVAEAGGEGSLFDKEPVKPWKGLERRRSLFCLGVFRLVFVWSRIPWEFFHRKFCFHVTLRTTYHFRKLLWLH